jgi:hypothetical protein
MNQTAIPCVFMRGGTSKGPYFLADDLPHVPCACDDNSRQGESDLLFSAQALRSYRSPRQTAPGLLARHLLLDGSLKLPE